MKPIKECYLAYPWDVDDGSDERCCQRLYNLAEHVTINLEKIANHNNCGLSPIAELIQELNVVKDCDAVCFCGDWGNDPILSELCRIIMNGDFGYEVNYTSLDRTAILFTHKKQTP